MKSYKLLRLINRAQHDLDEARKEVEIGVDINTVEDKEVNDEINEVRLRLDALEIRVSAIEEGY